VTGCYAIFGRICKLASVISFLGLYCLSPCRVCRVLQGVLEGWGV